MALVVFGACLKICYFDESGDSAVLASDSCAIQPMLVMGAMVIDAKFIPYITRDFLKLKRKFFPGIPHDSDYELSWIKSEIKGCDIRKNASKGRNKRRHTRNVLSATLELLEKYNCKVFGRIWIKGIGKEFKEVPVYTSSVQSICGVFQIYLEEQNDTGVVIGDSRSPGQNSTVAHSIFSKKMSNHGDKFDRIIDLPTFAHSENSACLQIADILSSAIVWPIAIDSFCKEHLESVHIRDGYDEVKRHHCSRLSKLQYRYQDENGIWRGGLIITNHLSKKKPSGFFQVCYPSPSKTLSNLGPSTEAAIQDDLAPLSSPATSKRTAE